MDLGNKIKATNGIPRTTKKLVIPTKEKIVELGIRYPKNE